jgi:hypothetical protein
MRNRRTLVPGRGYIRIYFEGVKDKFVTAFNGMIRKFLNTLAVNIEGIMHPFK